MSAAPARRQRCTADIVKALPTVRSYNALVVLIPGVVTSANDVVTGTSTTAFPIHGGRSNEGRLALDGLTVGGPSVGNSATSYVVDAGATEEVTFASAGGLGENETGGLVVNLVPKTGGNSTHGSLFFSGTGKKLQSDNLTPALKQQGVTAASPLSKVYDVSGTIGGPIARDRLWYFVTAHRGGSTTDSTNVYYNLNAGDPTKWSYAPDASRRAYSDRLFENASARVTWQMTRRHKVSVFWDEQTLCRTCTGATSAGIDPPRVSPEAVGVFGRPLRVTQATWSAPLSNRLLVDAGYGGAHFGFGNFEREPNPTRDLIRVVEQCASGCSANGNIPGLAYRSQDFSDAYNGSYLWKGSMSYVTGSHSVKVGYQHTLMTQDVHLDDEQPEPDLPVQQRRAESTDAIDFAVAEQLAHRVGRGVRAGTLDARPPDGTGRGAVRPRPELVSGAAGRAVQIPAGAHHHSGNGGRGQLQGHHAQARRVL